MTFFDSDVFSHFQLETVIIQIFEISRDGRRISLVTRVVTVVSMACDKLNVTSSVPQSSMSRLSFLRLVRGSSKQAVRKLFS